MVIEKSDYAKKYTALKSYIENHPALYKLICVLYRLTTGVMYLAYPVMLVYLFFTCDKRLVRAVTIPLVTVLGITVLRKLIDRPRPYQAHGFVPLFPKKTVGKSFPSRHVASAVIINFAFFYIDPRLGVAAIPITLLIAVLRPIAGVHYPGDVLGAVLISSVLGSAFYIF